MSTTPSILRHRTAMVRHSMSQPMSLLVRHGVIRDGITVFDYGCGQGDDLRALKAAGITCSGWDPHFASEFPKQTADIVNLGFVINVIEDIDERESAVKDAWALAGKALVVSAMISGQVPTEGLRPYRDGYLTSRSTFQKYYQHAELRSLVANLTGVDPVALAPGIFLAFRNPEDEQDFVFERRSGRRLSTQAYRVSRGVGPRTATVPVRERIPLAIEAIGTIALYRGRLPYHDELPTEALDELSGARVSFQRAVEAFRADVLDEAEFKATATSRKEDYLVHHALGFLNRTQSKSRPSAAMVRDVKSFFGSYKELDTEALTYLHSLADVGQSMAAMTKAVENGVGILDEDDRFVVDSSQITQMPGLLRCMLGCAEHLAGSLDGHYLVRLDPAKRRVDSFAYRGKQKPFPEVYERLSVDLRRQSVNVRPENRIILRKADLFGMSDKAKQRMAERERLAQTAGDVRRVMARVAE